MARHGATPHPWLRTFVDSYWASARDLSRIGGFTVTPDQTIELLFCADPVTVIDARGRAALPVCSVIGLLDAPIRLESDGVLRCASARLHAWAKGPLLGETATARGWHDATPIFAELVEPVLSALREERWIDLWQSFDAALIPRLEQARSASQAREFVKVTPPRAAEVGKAHGIGPRQVERNVRALTRTSPKQLASLARFQRARDALWERPDASLAALAASTGYADQAHLSREFKRYAGVTPRQFVLDSRKIRAWHAGALKVAIVQDERRARPQNPRMKIKLASINLETATPQTAKRFYIDVLEMVEDHERSHGDAFVYLRSEGCDITLATPEHAAGAEPSRTVELGFEVDDIDEARRRFERAGVTDVAAKSMGWGEVLEARDADGNRVIVYRFARG